MNTKRWGVVLLLLASNLLGCAEEKPDVLHPDSVLEFSEVKVISHRKLSRGSSLSVLEFCLLDRDERKEADSVDLDWRIVSLGLKGSLRTDTSGCFQVKIPISEEQARALLGSSLGMGGMARDMSNLATDEPHQYISAKIEITSHTDPYDGHQASRSFFLDPYESGSNVLWDSMLGNPPVAPSQGQSSLQLSQLKIQGIGVDPVSITLSGHVLMKVVRRVFLSPDILRGNNLEHLPDGKYRVRFFWIQPASAQVFDRFGEEVIQKYSQSCFRSETAGLVCLTERDVQVVGGQLSLDLTFDAIVEDLRLFENRSLLYVSFPALSTQWWQGSLAYSARGNGEQHCALTPVSREKNAEPEARADVPRSVPADVPVDPYWMKAQTKLLKTKSILELERAPQVIQALDQSHISQLSEVPRSLSDWAKACDLFFEKTKSGFFDPKTFYERCLENPRAFFTLKSFQILSRFGRFLKSPDLRVSSVDVRSSFFAENSVGTRTVSHGTKISVVSQAGFVFYGSGTTGVYDNYYIHEDETRTAVRNREAISRASLYQLYEWDLNYEGKVFECTSLSATDGEAALKATRGEISWCGKDEISTTIDEKWGVMVTEIPFSQNMLMDPYSPTTHRVTMVFRGQSNLEKALSVFEKETALLLTKRNTQAPQIYSVPFGLWRIE